VFLQVIQPEVKMRKKKTHLNYYTHENSSSEQPTRPPRTKEYKFPNCRISESQKQRFRPARPQSLDLSDSRYFTESSHNRSKDHLYPSQQLRRNFHSTQNLSGKHQTSNTNTTEKTSRTTHHLQPSLHNSRNYHSTTNLSERFVQHNTTERPRSVNLSFEEPIRVKSNYKLFPSGEVNNRTHQLRKNIAEESSKQYHSTGNIYKSIKQEKHLHGNRLLKNEPQYLSAGNVGEFRLVSEAASKKERKSSGQLIFSSEKPKKAIGSEYKTSSCEIFSMPREETRIIPIEIYSSSAPMSPLGSPSTKYKTRVVVNGAA